MTTLPDSAWSPINGVSERSIQVFQLPLTDDQIREIAMFAPVAVHIAGPRVKRADFGFFRCLPSVRIIRIFDSSVDVRTDDLRALPSLCEVTLGMGQRTALELAKLSGVRTLTGYWGDPMRITLECATLDSVCIIEYQPDSFSDIPIVHGLRSLAIPSARLSRFELPDWMRTLEQLNLKGGKRLATWGQYNLPNLLYLNLDGCRALDSIRPVFAIAPLTTLRFADAGKKDSLEGIDRLRSLERLDFSGSTNVRDGDLRPLLCLRRLRHISFANRSHYNLTREHLQRHVESRTEECST